MLVDQADEIRINVMSLENFNQLMWRRALFIVGHVLQRTYRVCVCILFFPSNQSHYLE